MLIPKSAEYALRCMAQIAFVPRGSSISADELHQLVGVPRDYLSKILRKLSSAGLLRAEKGHGGGFALAYPPSKITFLKILEAVGISLIPDNCVFGWGQCDSTNPCPLHDSFNKLTRQFHLWVSTTTLADANQTPAVIAWMKKLNPAACAPKKLPQKKPKRRKKS